MRRIIVNITLIIIAFALQNCIFPFIPFLSGAPNLLIILVFSYGFMYGEKEGMIYGLLAGLLMDLFYSGAFGFFTLIYLLIGFVNGSFAKYFYEDYITLPLVMCTVNEIIYNMYIYVFRFFIRGKTDLLFYIRSIILPELMITLLFVLVLYRILLVYNRRLEAIDDRRGRNIA